MRGGLRGGHPTLPGIVDFGLGVEQRSPPAVVERRGQIRGKHAGAVGADVEVVVAQVSQVHLRAGEWGTEKERASERDRREERESASRQTVQWEWSSSSVSVSFSFLLLSLLLGDIDAMTAALSSLIPVMMFCQSSRAKKCSSLGNSCHNILA